MNKNTSAWLHGLLAALIGGGASAVTSGVVLPAISPNSFNFAGQLLPLAKVMLGMFLVNGAISAFAYLKQSPLPAQTLEISETTTQKTTLTATPSDKP